MGEIQVVKVDEDTVDEVCDFMQPAYADCYPNADFGITRDAFEGPFFRDNLRNYLMERTEPLDSELYAGYIAGKAIGSIGIEIKPETPRVGEIWGFYVEVEQQGNGLGRLLWNDLMSRPHVTELDSLRLWVAKNLHGAIDFYEKEGFFKAGEDVWDWPNWTEPKGQNDYWLMER
jgi:ribosomal protein S18 acetylase RimI-like enzyme